MILCECGTCVSMCVSATHNTHTNTYTLTHRQTHTHTHRQTDRQTDRETNRQLLIYTYYSNPHIHTLIYKPTRTHKKIHSLVDEDQNIELLKKVIVKYFFCLVFSLRIFISSNIILDLGVYLKLSMIFIYCILGWYIQIVRT